MPRLIILTILFFFSTGSFGSGAEIREETRELIEKGLEYKNAGQQEKAVELFQQAIRSDPEYADGYLQLGFSLQQLKHYREAITAYESGLKLNPQHPHAAEAYYNISAAADHLGDGEKAIACLKKALQAYTDRMDHPGVFKTGRALQQLSKKYPQVSQAR